MTNKECIVKKITEEVTSKRFKKGFLLVSDMDIYISVYYVESGAYVLRCFHFC